MLRKLGLIVCCLILSSSAWAQNNGPQKFLLDNGLTVLVNEMPGSLMAAVHVWIKTGSASEGKYIGSGVTHFLEHMLFKGTKRRGVGQVPEEARAMGGSINASTGYDHTVFTLSVPQENFARGLDLVADMVQNAVIDPQETERERLVILKEMKMLNDRPERKLDDLVYKSVYLQHPYQHPIIGHEEIFKALTRENIVDYYQAYYVPNNMIVSVAGGVVASQVLDEVKKAFANARPRSFPDRVLPVEPEQITPRYVEGFYPTELIRLSLAYQGVPLLHEDLYALDVLAMALGQGESSRFYRDLYKKQSLVEAISASNYTPADKGFFEVSCLLKTDTVKDVTAHVQKIINTVAKTGLDQKELDKVKRQVMVDNIHSRETAEGMASRMAMEEAFAGDVHFSENYLDGIRAVTNDDIRRVAKKYLVPSRLTATVLKPQVVEQQTAGSAAEEKPLVERVVLPNGLVLLLGEDHALPVLTFNVLIGGGLKHEPEDLPGLSELTARVWNKGLRGKSAEEISRQVESRGASLSAGSGADSFSLSVSSLSDDLDFSLDKLEDLVKAPTFPALELKKEKEQMLVALQSRKDSVFQMSIKALREELFLTHPVRRDALGTPESLARITRQDIVRYYEHFLSPTGMVIAAFGDMDKDKLKAELTRRFGSLKPRAVDLPKFDEPAPEALRLKEMTMDKEQAIVLYGFRAPDLYSQDRYALSAAVNILSSSLGGRMFKRIRDELGQAYTLGGSYSPGRDVGMVIFYVLTTNDNIDKVRAIMDEELRLLSETLALSQELDSAKAYLISAQARSLQTSGARAGTCAVDEFLGRGFEDYKNYAARMNAVTLEDVRRVAALFDTGRAAVVITRSSSKDLSVKNSE